MTVGDPATAKSPDRPGTLLTHRAFMLVLASKTASTVATAGTWVVLPLYAYEITDSAALAGLVSAMNVIPYLLFGMVAGVFVDRAAPRRLLVSMELVNAVVLLSVPALAATDTLSAVALCAFGFTTATVFVWFDVASAAFVPALVGKERVFQANGHLWAVATLVTATAGPSGFFLLTNLGVGGTFAFLAAFSALSAGLLAMVRVPETERPPSEPRRRPVAELTEGLRFIANQPTVRLLTLVGIGSGLSAGGVYGLIVVFANRALSLGTQDYRISWIIAGSSVGALIASLVAPRLRGRPPVAVVTAFLTLEVGLMAAYALSTGWIAALVAIFLWNLAHTTLMIFSISARQFIAPPEMQGRVNAAGRAVVWGCVPLGSTVCGVLAEVSGIRGALLMFLIPALASLVLTGFAFANRRQEVTL
ncbi:MFS transporter [Microbispora amethystogenes]|uniref:MFS transporter n=1 Tax=Microbispora amethystogenes TaxID=1427754 RepID=UPI0033C8A3B1